MKTLKKMLLFVPLSHLCGIGLSALLCAARKDAADPASAAGVIGIVSLLAAGLCLGFFCSLIGRFGVREGMIAGAAFALTDLIAGLVTGHFSPSAPAISALAAAGLLPVLFCLGKSGRKTHSGKSKKRAAARYFAK